MTTDSPETARLEAHLEHVREDINEMKAVIAEVGRAIKTLTAIETKQGEQGSAIGRAFGEIAEVRGRVSALELQQPMNKQTNGIVSKAVEMILIAVFGALIALVVSKPAEVKLQPAVVQAYPAAGGKTMESQTNGAPK